MNDLELAWLVPTALQVLGLAIALGVLGFAYEGATRERKPLAGALEEWCLQPGWDSHKRAGGTREWRGYWRLC